MISNGLDNNFPLFHVAVNYAIIPRFCSEKAALELFCGCLAIEEWVAREGGSGCRFVHAPLQHVDHTIIVAPRRKTNALGTSLEQETLRHWHRLRWR
jgi:hypothetical protein